VSARPAACSFWYIVAANCRSFEDIYYEVRFKNQGGSWVNEFGVNEQRERASARACATVGVQRPVRARPL
jgi:hypothetical protein